MTARPKIMAAFTLAELMFAIGILGIGLGLAAMLFPTAIKEHERSAGDYLGITICQNGLAVAKTMLTHSYLSGNPGNLVHYDPLSADPDAHPFCFPTLTSFIPPGQPSEWISMPPNYYPRTLYGYLILARQAVQNENDYQLVIASYLKTSPANRVTPRIRTVANVGTGGTTLTFQPLPPTEQEWLVAGSHVVSRGSATDPSISARIESAPIVDKTGTTITLDRVLEGVSSGDTAFTFAEIDPTTGNPLPRRNPILAVMSVRTGLPE